MAFIPLFAKSLADFPRDYMALDAQDTRTNESSRQNWLAAQQEGNRQIEQANQADAAAAKEQAYWNNRIAENNQNRQMADTAEKRRQYEWGVGNQESTRRFNVGEDFKNQQLAAQIAAEKLDKEQKDQNFAFKTAEQIASNPSATEEDLQPYWKAIPEQDKQDYLKSKLALTKKDFSTQVSPYFAQANNILRQARENIYYAQNPDTPKDAPIPEAKLPKLKNDDAATALRTFSQSTDKTRLDLFDTLTKYAQFDESKQGFVPIGSATKTATSSADYRVGAIYSGMKYLGGDPNSEQSWQRIR